MEPFAKKGTPSISTSLPRVKVNSERKVSSYINGSVNNKSVCCFFMEEFFDFLDLRKLCISDMSIV